MNRSDQLVVDVTLATACLRFSITAGFDLARGIMHTKLAARSSSLLLLGVAKLGALQCMVRESQSSKSPASIWHMMGWFSAKFGSSFGKRK